MCEKLLFKNQKPVFYRALNMYPPPSLPSQAWGFTPEIGKHTPAQRPANSVYQNLIHRHQRLKTTGFHQQLKDEHVMG